jgi:hypothetical protein
MEFNITAIVVAIIGAIATIVAALIARSPRPAPTQRERSYFARMPSLQRAVFILAIITLPTAWILNVYRNELSYYDFPFSAISLIILVSAFLAIIYLLVCIIREMFTNYINIISLVLYVIILIIY